MPPSLCSIDTTLPEALHTREPTPGGWRLSPLPPPGCDSRPALCHATSQIPQSRLRPSSRNHDRPSTGTRQSRPEQPSTAPARESLAKTIRTRSCRTVRSPRHIEVTRTMRTTDPSRLTERTGQTGRDRADRTKKVYTVFELFVLIDKF